MAYRLSQSADSDLEIIYQEGIRRFGAPLAVAYLQKLDMAFEILAEHPAMGRVRPELGLTIRSFIIGSHLILYQPEGDGHVLVVRVRHQREDVHD